MIHTIFYFTLCVIIVEFVQLNVGSVGFRSIIILECLRLNAGGLIICYLETVWLLERKGVKWIKEIKIKMEWSRHGGEISQLCLWEEANLVWDWESWVIFTFVVYNIEFYAYHEGEGNLVHFYSCFFNPFYTHHFWQPSDTLLLTKWSWYVTSK